MAASISLDVGSKSLKSLNSSRDLAINEAAESSGGCAAIVFEMKAGSREASFLKFKLGQGVRISFSR